MNFKYLLNELSCRGIFGMSVSNSYYRLSFKGKGHSIVIRYKAGNDTAQVKIPTQIFNVPYTEQYHDPESVERFLCFTMLSFLGSLDLFDYNTMCYYFPLEYNHLRTLDVHLDSIEEVDLSCSYIDDTDIFLEDLFSDLKGGEK